MYTFTIVVQLCVVLHIKIVSALLSKSNKRILSNSVENTWIKITTFRLTKSIFVLCFDDSSDLVCHQIILRIIIKYWNLSNRSSSLRTLGISTISQHSRTSWLVQTLLLVNSSGTFYLIVRPNGRRNFNTITGNRIEVNASFHTLQFCCKRTYYSIVITNLHYSNLITVISSAFLEDGHFVKWVIYVKNKNKCGLSLFFVDLIRQENSNGILYKYLSNTVSLLNTKVIIEIER